MSRATLHPAPPVWTKLITPRREHFIAHGDYCHHRMSYGLRSCCHLNGWPVRQALADGYLPGPVPNRHRLASVEQSRALCEPDARWNRCHRCWVAYSYYVPAGCSDCRIVPSRQATAICRRVASGCHLTMARQNAANSTNHSDFPAPGRTPERPSAM